jgi:ribosomal protein S18 acetylase RimI-like enzyme
VDLWRECGLVVARNDPAADIRRKLQIQRDMFLVGLHGSELVATVMAGYEGHRGWINYLAVKPAFRRRGLGRRLMAEAEERLIAAGCPKINLQVRNSNADALAFYERIGYSSDDVTSMGKRLEEDR